MAMLAEPRQRKRFNLVPRGKPLYEDESRFGTKMLEKMGWTKGQGLGVNEEGTKDFVRVKYKNDSLGLGFKDRDDQWTQHEQSFNGLLQTLNNKETNEDLNTNQENGNEFEDDMPRIGFGFQSAKVAIEKTQKAGKLKEKISGVSLEERSKQSKARVHYKKFTRGKDLAQYSEKDLANIFGKKPLDDQATSDFHINTGVSVNDYFKTKMEAIKNQNNGLDIGVKCTNEETIPNTDELKDGVTRNEKVKRIKEDEHNMKTTTNSQITYSNVSVNDYFKMKMEAVKTKKNVLNAEEINLDTNNFGEDVQEDTTKKKKKPKKDKRDQENIVEGEKIQNNIGNSAGETANNIRVEIKKEKKSKKCNVDDTAASAAQERKHKKNKSKNKIEDEIKQHNELINTANLYPKTKKRKHEVSTEEYTTTEYLIDEPPQTDLTQEPAKKKQKKNKTKETNELININSSANEFPVISENQTSVEEVKKNSIASNQIENITQPSKKSKKTKRKDVSSHAKNEFITDVNNQELDLKDERDRYKEFNIFSISSFCAEKFRNINLNDFTGSSLPQIEGYGLGSELQLNVQIDKNDEERITNLWSCALNKYYQIEKPKKTYQQYVREVITSRKTQKKRPKLYIKTWQRKNAFQML